MIISLFLNTYTATVARTAGILIGVFGAVVLLAVSVLIGVFVYNRCHSKGGMCSSQIIK